MFLTTVCAIGVVGAKTLGTTLPPSPLLAFLSDRAALNTSNDVIVVDVASGIAINITREVDGTPSEVLTWNHSGELAFVNHGNDMEIYIWNGIWLTNVSQNPLTDRTPVWSEDGRLAFISYRDNRWRIYVWDHGVLTDLGQTVEPSISPAWNSDGRLAFGVLRMSSDDQQVFRSVVDLYIWDGITSSSIDSVDSLDGLRWAVGI
jgi:hypothetical protein